jgi:hypothetical protein
VGDIYRTVQICGVDDKGDVRACRDVKALLDTGATRSVIGSALAERLQGAIQPKGTEIEGREVPLMAARFGVRAPDCIPWRNPVIVDDDLVERAGARAGMILGTDYMQRRDMVLLLSDNRRKEGVASREQPPPKINGKSSPRKRSKRL